MKRFVKCVCLVVVLSLFLSSASLAAEQEPSGTYSLYFTSYGAALAKITDRTFEIGFDLVGHGMMNEIGVSRIELQRSTNGSSGWTAIKTFTPENYAQMMNYDASFHGDCVNYTGAYGYYYRAYVTFYASNDSGSGQISRYTNVLKI